MTTNSKFRTGSKEAPTEPFKRAVTGCLRAILRQDPSLVTQGVVPQVDATCPYLGLVAYDVGDAPAYFGREADATACLARLGHKTLLIDFDPQEFALALFGRASLVVGELGTLTLEQATIESVNTVWAQVIQEIGAEKVVEAARSRNR